MTSFVTIGTRGAAGATGWTTFRASDGTGPSGLTTSVIYVSSSAAPGGNGSLAAPYQTLAAGYAALTDGHPDWLLCKKGDTWSDGGFDFWRKSGPSADEPMVLGSYDPAFPGVVDPYGSSLARPIINGTGNANDNGRSGLVTFNGSVSVAIVGIESYPTITTGDVVGIGQIAVPQQWLLVENCKIHKYGINIDWGIFDTPNNYCMLRRSIILDSISTAAYGQGVHPGNNANLNIEECVIDHSSWLDLTDTTVNGFEGFRRNMYVAQYGNIAGTIIGPPIASFRDNIVARSTSQGVQFRTGVVDCSNNLFVANTNGLNLGHPVWDNMPQQPTVAVAQNNVITSSIVLSGTVGGTPETYIGGDGANGASINYCSGTGVQLVNNLFANAIGVPNNSNCVDIDPDTVGVTVTGNTIYNWGGFGVRDRGTGNTVSGNTIDGLGYPNPNRKVGYYSAEASQTTNTYDYEVLGGDGSLVNFLGLARLLSKSNWDSRLLAPAVNDWMRAGFGLFTHRGGRSWLGRF